MAQKQIAPHRRTVELELDAELYEALMEAGQMQGLTTSNEILETLAFQFIAQAARDSGLVEQMKERQQDLKQQLPERQHGSKADRTPSQDR